MPPEFTVTELLPSHWPDVARIYADGIATGNATFVTEVPAWEVWDAQHLADHRFVAERSGAVVGWTAVSPVSDNCAFGGVVENSVYVAADARRSGVGAVLLQRLIASTEAAGIWTLQNGIFPENVGSLLLHERAGFTVVGRRARLGRLNGEWRDVVMTERRSPAVA